MKRTNAISVVGALAALSAVSAIAEPAEPPEAVPAEVLESPVPDWAGRIWLGPAWRRGSKLSGTWTPERLRGAFPRPYRRSSSSEGSLPPLGGYVDRDYEDGYVHLDEGTVDPETDTFGITWNWGYQNAGQYDGSTVSFHGGGGGSSDSYSSVAAAPTSFSEDLGTLDGWEIGGLWHAFPVLEGTLGLSASARFFSGEEARFAGAAKMGREEHSSYTVFDVYDAHWPDFPSAPYAGDVEGPGYLLDQIPLARNRKKGPSSRKDWSVRSSAKAEFEAWDLRVGPTLEWRLCSWAEVAVSAAFSLARASLDLDATSTVYAGSRAASVHPASASEDKWLPGAALAASVGIDLPWGFFVDATVARDWYDGDVRATAGPFDVRAKLGETTYSVAIGKDF